MLFQRFSSIFAFHGRPNGGSGCPAVLAAPCCFQAVEKVIDAHAKHMIDNNWVEVAQSPLGLWGGFTSTQGWENMGNLLGKTRC